MCIELFGDLLEGVYPPPRDIDVPDVGEHDLEERLLEDPCDKAALFLLGNSYLRRREGQKAVDVFHRYLDLDTNNPQVRHNLALAHLLCGDAAAAAMEFKRALLQDPMLVKPLLGLARLGVDCGDIPQAIEYLEKALRVCPESAEAHAAMGGLLESQGRLEEAAGHYERSLETACDSALVRRRLGRMAFLDGESLFCQGKREEAFAVWSEGRKRFGAVARQEKDLFQREKLLIAQYLESGDLETALNSYLEELLQDPPKTSGAHRVVSRFLFTLGLVDECYEKADDLAEAETLWSAEGLEEEEMPYRLFRLGLVYFYQGREEEALSVFKHAADVCPKKKHHSLRLDEVCEFTKRVLGRKRAALADRRVVADTDEWEQAGFVTPFEQQAWKRSGLSPKEAAVWRLQGFTPGQSQKWVQAGMDPGEAVQWSQAGFPASREVFRWVRGGFDPIGARCWREAFGSAVDLAVQCKKLGFEDAETAVSWLRVFSVPWEGLQWKDLGFTPEEAHRWLSQGVKDPFLARKRREEELSDGDCVDNEGSGQD